MRRGTEVTGPGRPPGSPSRRLLIRCLGALWLLDGCLQTFQPHMWTEAFFGQMFEGANVSLPSWLTTVEVHLDTLISVHPLPWDIAFGGLEMALGLALLSGRFVRTALLVSVAWAASVWLVGEGLGGLTLSGANPLTGAPGPAALYALGSLLLWPAGPDDRPAAADHSRLGPLWSKVAWAGLWLGTAALWLEYQSHMAEGPGGQLTGAGNGEPGWLASFNHGVGSAAGSSGPALAALLASLQILAGVGIFGPLRIRRAALVIAGVLALFYGVLGQDLGGLLTGQATDPGTAFTLLLSAAALWPRRPAPVAATVAGAGPKARLAGVAPPVSA